MKEVNTKTRFASERDFNQALENGKKVKHDSCKTVFHMNAGTLYDQDGYTWHTPLLELMNINGWHEVN